MVHNRNQLPAAPVELFETMAAVVAESGIGIVQFVAPGAGSGFGQRRAAVIAEAGILVIEGVAFVAADLGGLILVGSIQACGGDAGAKALADAGGEGADAVFRPVSHVVEGVLDDRGVFFGDIAGDAAHVAVAGHHAANERQGNA